VLSGQSTLERIDSQGHPPNMARFASSSLKPLILSFASSVLKLSIELALLSDNRGFQIQVFLSDCRIIIDTSTRTMSTEISSRV
jgi:hypothetical protein